MWKRGGRTSALDRAQVLLSAQKRCRESGLQSSEEPGVSTPGSLKPRSAPANTATLFSDLSDLSSVSSAAEIQPVRPTPAGQSRGGELDSEKGARPPSSLGGGSRFLKKPPPPISSSQSPVSRNTTQQPRYVTSSQRGSQNAALNRLAEIESGIRNRNQALRASNDISPPAAAQSPDAPPQISTASSTDSSPKGTRFLKKKAAGALENTKAASAAAAGSSDVAVRSRTALPVFPSRPVDTSLVKGTTVVSLDSDEEDMKKLLGDSVDWTDYSSLKPGRPSSVNKPDKKSSRSHLRLPSPPPLLLDASLHTSSPSSKAPPRLSPTPPPHPHRDSPFRYTGQAQSRFSPSRISPSPSPAPVEEPNPACSPQPSLSSPSGCREVLSLEELFTEEQHSDVGSVYSDDFRVNVMTLDDLAPAASGLEAGKLRELEHNVHPPESSHNHHQVEEEEEEEEDYPSDFESESKTETHHSASQVSEHLQGDDEEEEEEEVSEEHPDASGSRTQDDDSSAFSDRSDLSGSSQTWTSSSRSRRDSRCSSSSRRRTAAAGRTLRDSAVQTLPHPPAHTTSPGFASLGPAVSSTFMNPAPVFTHTLSAEALEALGSFNPPLFSMNEMFRQQLNMMAHFYQTNRHLHTRLMQSLEPPNYTYTTLEDTKEFIRKQRRSSLRLEEREFHCCRDPVTSSG